VHNCLSAALAGGGISHSAEAYSKKAPDECTPSGVGFLLRSAVLVPPPARHEQDKSQKLRNGNGQRRNIGHGGGVEHLFCADKFVLRQHTALPDGFQRAVARVELDRQRYKLEENAQRKEEQAHIRKRVKDVRHPAQNNADNDERHRELGADVRHRYDGHAELDRSVALRVLAGVTRLVRGDADGGGRGAAVNVVRKVDGVVARVVIVRELARNALDAHICNPVRAQNALGGLRPREAGRGTLFAVFFKGGLHVPARDHREKKNGQNNNKIGPVHIHASEKAGRKPFTF